MNEMSHVFISRPTRIGEAFERAYVNFNDFLDHEGFVARRLGNTDYSRKAPLQAVIDIMDECCGAIVLGYPQLEFRHEVRRSTEVREVTAHVFPTPWNQIEGALAYRTRTPVLVVAYEGVSGGVFDHGVTGEGVLHVDLSRADWFQQAAFLQPFREWKMEVKNKNQK